MDASLYAKILSDKSITDLKKIKYKFPDVDMKELIGLLKTSVYKTMPIPDFTGNDLVYMENAAQVQINAVKLLLTPQSSNEPFGLKAMEDEIASSFTIESIDFSRDSVRKILRGYAPADESENRIYGMKKGLEFISDPDNEITEENIHTLYDIAIGQYLPENVKLKSDMFYRHDSVYIVGQELEHTGLPYEKLSEYMSKFMTFINAESTINDLLKAAVIHFYIAYLHPYFDGNGRMARLMYLWYLKRQGYSSALFIPFSSYIERSRKGYYSAYSLAEENAKISGVMDVTPFLVYFIENVYNKLGSTLPLVNNLESFRKALDDGQITEKEKDLWNFALSAYGIGEFSTKQLERDFGNAAYATIRGFVLKFEGLGLLSAQKYGNKVKYSVRDK
ncbi:Fic family protein [Caproiciproducens sp.]|uniref:Fic family protein n=1 Tax=Caproiciproducens sp. TaxID=1954376 RepID=UPI00289E399B|nr:Fic family protein [Caproiciproducens sp.]